MPADKTDDISKVLSNLPDLAGRVDPVTLRVFFEELFRWNPRLGLVSKRDTSGVVVKLTRQSVRLWDFARGHLKHKKIHQRFRTVDIGTGAGFPGLVWKLLAPGLNLVLIERKDRKVTFLERVVALAGLTAVDIVALDLRVASRRQTFQGVFDLAVMMAVSRPEPMVADISRILKTAGFFCTLRGGAEPAPPPQLGRSLTLRSRRETPDEQMVLYEKAPIQC